MELTIIGKTSDYLKHGTYIDFEDEDIMDKAEELKDASFGQLDLIERTFRFVRDEIKHSWDAQDPRVTVKASEVLREGVGICWSKALLLAALLRANRIPAGVCYQKLPFDLSENKKYCIHALTALYIPSRRLWCRLDSRGNKNGVNAQFDFTNEKLAFACRADEGAVDYKIVYPEPPKILTDTLEKGGNMLDIYLNNTVEDL